MTAFSIRDIDDLKPQERRYDVPIEDDFVVSVLPNGIKTWVYVHEQDGRLQRRTLEHRERQTHRVPRRGNRVASLEETIVRTRERVDGDGILADEKRGSRQALEILRVERRFAIGLRERRARVRPCLPLERVSAARERSDVAHARSIS